MPKAKHDTGGQVYLTASQVRERYGDIADMTLWRWLRDPDLGFPQPEYRRRRRYWLAADLDAYDARIRAARPASPSPSGNDAGAQVEA